MARLEREFNEANLLKGLDYLAGINNWEESFIEKSKAGIHSYEEQKKKLIQKSNKAEMSTLKEIDEFLNETSGFLKDIFITERGVFSI